MDNGGALEKRKKSSYQSGCSSVWSTNGMSGGETINGQVDYGVVTL